MEKLIDSIQKWLKRNKAEDNHKDQTETKRKEHHYFSQQDPYCLFCDQNQWGDSCPTYDTIAKRREFFTAKRYNVTIAPAQDTLGKNVVVGSAISVRANTTPAYVTGPRGVRRKIATDQFRYIEIQPKTIDLSMRLLGITKEFVGFIPRSLMLKSIVLG